MLAMAIRYISNHIADFYNYTVRGKNLDGKILANGVIRTDWRVKYFGK